MKKRADYKVQTLEDQVLVDATEAVKGINQLKSGIASLKKQIDSFSKNNGLSDLNKDIKKISLSDAIKKSFNFSAIILGGKQVLNTLKEMTNASIDYTETVNLFNVSMGKDVEGLNKYYEQALEFQEKLEEKLGVNLEESMRYQALFNSMTKSMGLGANYAYTLSENMTKLGYDLASLYNIDTESAMTKLRAGLAGQTEPLRELGLDITEQSLKPVAESLGVTESIRNMSQAEKAVLRYIAVLRQAQIAQGDFARTMDSPANQLRIFNAQVTAFKRNMGNLWQGILGGILPYVNAVMMVINELLKMVAKLFGFEVYSQPINVSDSIGASDLAGDLGTASDNAKKLKNQLMGFDEINNINLDNGTSSGGISGGSIGGIDQRLLDSLKGYDNWMDKISNKATEIKDKILEWLGFTEDVNGELKWSWDNMNDIVKILITISGIIGGIYVIGKITKLVQGLKNLVKILRTGKGATTTFGQGLQTIGNVIRGLKDGFKNFSTWISMVVDQYKTFRNQGDSVITSLKKTNTQLKDTGQGFSSLFPQISKVVKIIGGTAGLVASNILAYQSMEDLANGTISVEEGMGKLVTSIGGATVSGALLGSTFGPVGAVIGGLTGFITSSTSAFIGYNTRLREVAENNKKVKEALESTITTHEANIKAIEENRDAQLINIEVAKEEAEQLEHMIDSNGKVKDSYKQRAEYILNDLNEALGTDYELTGNQIKANGKLIDSYEELQDSMDDYIKKKEEEIYLESYLETYKDEIKESIELQKQEKEAQQSTNEARDEYNRLLQEGTKQVNLLGMAINGYETTIAKGKYEEAIENQKALGEAVADNALDIANAEESWKNYYTEITNDSTEAMNTIAQTTEQTLINQTKTVEDLTPETIDAWKNMASQSASKYETNLLKTSTATQIVLDALVGNVDVTTPTYIEKWRKLAKDSENEYYQALSKLPDDTQGQILASVAVVDGMNDTNINAYRNLSEQGKQAFNNALSSIDTDTRNKIESTINEVYAQQGNMSTATSSLATNATNSFNNSLGSTTGSANNWLQGFVNVLSKWDPLGILSKAQNLAEKVCERFNIGLGNHSPSKKTRKSAQFFVEGFRRQIDTLLPSSVAQVSGLAEQITKGFNDNLKISSLSDSFNVDTNAISVNSNQFLDYGEISGAIATKSNIDIEDNMIDRMGQACYNAFTNAMKTQGIRADIKVEPDKEGIFKSVQVQAEQFVTQTGEEPFPSPA